MPPARRRGILFFAQTGGAPFVTVFGARKKFSHFAKKLLDIVPTAWYYNKRSKRAAVCAGQKIEYALLAQLDRVFGYEPKGQGFESLAAHQKSRMQLRSGFLLIPSSRFPFSFSNPLHGIFGGKRESGRRNRWRDRLRFDFGRNRHLPCCDITKAQDSVLCFFVLQGGRAPAGSPKAPSVGSCRRRRLMRGDLPARITLRKNTDSVKQALCKREGPGRIRRFSNSHIKKPGASVRTHRVFLCGHSRPTAATAFTCGMRLTGL